MRKSPINIIGGFYKDPNLHWSRQDTLNWIPVGAEQPGTLTQWQLRDAPGVKPYVRITRTVPTEEGNVVIDVGPIRGMRNVEGKFFVVAAQTVYQISNTGVAIPVGSIPGVGRVSMAHNQYGLSNQLIIVNGSAGYIVDTNLLTVTKITDEGYPGAFVADYIDQYLAQVEPQGRFWFHSDLAQGLHYNTLDRYEAEADPDRIVSLLVSHREVLIFGRDTIEPFVNTGGQTGTFERASNTVIEVGCAAKFTPRKLDNSVFWLDDKRLVRRLDGYTPIRISTDAIDAAFSECSEQEISQAYAFTWETRGHKVYYITVPGRFTFGFDVLTRQWHRRATWGLPHWDAVDAVFWNGRWYIGSGQNGRIYELDQDYKLDRCDPLVRKRITGKLWDAENELTLNNVELKFNTGGVESVCVPFPVQPIGPTMTGNAPGGALAQPYTFTYTVTPGDAPIARTVIMSGTLLDGLSWNQYTATLSGTPEETGTMVLSFRTYDENGLFDDHTDTIPIQEILIAFGQIGPGSKRTLVIPDSTDWNESPEFAPSISGGIVYALGIPGRGLAWSVSQLAYTDDYGGTWTVSAADLGGSGGARNACFRANGGTEMLLIAGGLSGIYKSFDGGETVELTAYPTHPRSGYCGWVGDRLIICSAYNSTFHYSDSTLAEWTVDDETFVAGGALGMDVGTGAMLCFDDVCIAGGRETSGSGKPELAITQDGVTVVNRVLTAAADGGVTAIAAAMVGEDEIWVVGTTTGELIWSDDRFTTHQLCTGGLSIGITCGLFDGIRFVFAGSSTGSEAKYSQDGKTFAASDNVPFTTSIDCLLKISNE